MNCSLRRSGARLCLVVCVITFAAELPAAAQSGAQISGTVRNQSVGRPPTGDEVVLFLMNGGLTEEARTTTDASGRFSMDVRHAHKPYLVRVVHQGVNYERAGVAGENLSIQVFDAATQVNGVSASIEILRVGTETNRLHVSDMIEITNESNPPVTQVGERTLEVSLPASARIDSVLAAGPGNIARAIAAAPVPDRPRHYAVGFPLQPGRTKFAFNYDVPYKGHAAFQSWHAYSLQQMALMIPQNMEFHAPPAAFQVLATGSRDYKVEATNWLAAGAGPKFEVSGFGALPPLGEKSQAKKRAQPQLFSSPAVAAPPAGHHGSPAMQLVDQRSQQVQGASQTGVLSAMCGALLALCVYFVRRGGR